MLAWLLTAALSSGNILVLDAREGSPRCGAATPDEVLVCARNGLPGTRFPVEIKGVTGTVLVEPSGPNILQCDPDYMARLGIKAAFRPAGVVGPVRAQIATTSAMVSLLGKRTLRTVQWTALPAVRDAECVIGPLGLSYSSVRFVLGSPGGQPVAKTFPIVSRSGVRTLDRPYAAVFVGKQAILTRFELSYARTVLTAPAARIVAPVLGGTASGTIDVEEILFGISRPLRPLTLRQPLMIGVMRVKHPYIRVADYGEAARISAVDPEEIGPDDVVVSAKPPKPGAVKFLRVGAEDLSACSTIEVSRLDGKIVLTC